ncbi:helix-turn-helix transcriptional regulator [Nonomuraea basaltis]|uniref:helix-turn-helix transcriptional regulator n=1 Tax=Nonomuraea basaltis TaxID=2495887 RepID=UPI001F10659C|nr:hypothetical protein [Nonomuraea basaltis]
MAGSAPPDPARLRRRRSHTPVAANSSVVMTEVCHERRGDRPAPPGHGEGSPSLEVAFQIARVFNVPLDDVFGYPDTDT